MSYHLRLGLPSSGLFPVGLPVNILKALLPSSILATWLAHLNFLDLITLITLGEPDDWRSYLRMDTSAYCQLLEFVTPYILKQDTCMRKAITPHERLTATLRYLATGRSLKDLEFTTIMHKPALSQIIPETCDAIYLVLKKNYLKVST